MCKTELQLYPPIVPFQLNFEVLLKRFTRSKIIVHLYVHRFVVASGTVVFFSFLMLRPLALELLNNTLFFAGERCSQHTIFAIEKLRLLSLPPDCQHVVNAATFEQLWEKIALRFPLVLFRFLFVFASAWTSSVLHGYHASQ